MLAILCDLVSSETFHATVSNAFSMGFEMAELAGGGVYQATLDTAVKATLAIAEATGVQLQVPTLGSYNGHPLRRMLDGGTTCVGVFGHRDNTEDRGRWILAIASSRCSSPPARSNSTSPAARISRSGASARRYSSRRGTT